MGVLKVKEFPGLQRLAPETIEKHEMEQVLRDAQFALDVQLHDLRSECLQREGKLRQDYLVRVAEIAATWRRPRDHRFSTASNHAEPWKCLAWLTMILARAQSRVTKERNTDDRRRNCRDGSRPN